MSDVLYKPSKWGMEFHALPHTEALGAGSVGPGKSTVLIHEPMTQITVEHARVTRQWDMIGPPGHWLRDLAEQHPLRKGESTGHALYLRRSMASVDQIFSRIRRLVLGLDPGASANETKRTFTLSSGYKYQVGHCYNIGDYMNYYSNEYSILCWDELIEFDQEQYDHISSRLRSSDPVLGRLLKNRAMSNPVARRVESSGSAKVRDPHWVRKYFVDPAPEGRVTLKRAVKKRDGSTRDLTRIYLPAKLWDNPDKGFVEEYETRLLGMPSHMRKALLEGDWYVTADSFFADAWNADIHVIKPFRIPGHWKRFRSMDWGYKAPGVVHWWAMDEDDNLYCEYEYTFQGKLDKEVAKEVKDIEKRLGLWGRKGSMITGPADTQLWEERGDSGKTKAQNFLEAGVPWTKCEKSRRTAAYRITQRLNDHDFGTTKPGLMFFATCKNAIRTLPSLQTDPNDAEVPVDGGDDHWFDCLHGDTLVTTDRGLVKIRELLPTDLVQSADGAFHACTGGRKVKDSDQLYTVEFDDGSELLATENHLLLCHDGVWRRVDQLDSMCYAFRPWIQQSSAKQSKSSVANAITDAATISSAMAKGYIGLCGKAPTDQFQTDTKSTTLTKTGPTTPCETLNAGLSESIECTMVETTHSAECSQETSPKLRRQPRPGTLARKASSGTDSMPTSQSLASTVETRSACSAEDALWTGAPQGELSSAGKPALPSTGESPELTTSNEYALPAGQRSWLAGSAVREPVHGNVLRISSVKPATVADTWCTTVPGMGSFVAGGVVVSNSIGYACAFASNGRKGIPSLRKDNRYRSEKRDDRGRSGYGF